MEISYKFMIGKIII